ncbi:hypothetical protein [Streptococcus pyogenes]|uniref:hypothetical protein n=1 Tax=Streptococcus pyogenes TaxID=1314 RepID=UPI0004BE4442|nr:hypothetical protein [Streptococcus pyogenes]OAC59131.1 hypothetical protein AWU03_06400 [Streptococcus pyogenes]OAC62272.1 hypothetical protein AWU05_07850 [Streptococcus pyogenes]OAC62877.1 hypothetical protein AWU06_07880 [Streptococcus pyogenes]OAC73188.1 hypothetical protein AWU01_05980 [Streptococcus pyogenes]VGS08671.1 hypothetical membrane associated protein [Streptococcus pyogenes]
MKTKSKRFLKLATLCLALLGTALLMGRPVKAEEQDSYIQERYRNDLDLTEDDFREYLQNPYHKYRFEGYKDGYKEGSQPGAPEMDTNELNEKAIKKAGEGNHGEGYSDGYESGYYQASYETHHPIMAAIGSFLSWLWDLFTTEE